MKRWFHAPVTIAASLALAGGAMSAATVPAAASGVHDNFAYGAYAPTGAITSRLHGLAESPPQETTVVANVDVSGLLSSGAAIDSALTSGSSSKIPHVRASTSWASNGTTYTFTLVAAQVASFCTNSSSSASAFTRIFRGKLTESAQTGSTTATTVYHLPRRPSATHAYTYNGGTVTLNEQTVMHGMLETQGIAVTTPAQTLWIAVTGCEPGGGPGAIANGGFESSASSVAPWSTTGTVAVESAGVHGGSNAAQVGPATKPGTAGSSTISQTFIADGNELSLWYERRCSTGTGNDASITLTDLTSGTPTTPLPSACATDANWAQLSADLRPGDTYTLTLTNDNGTVTANDTLLDDVAVSYV
jgi:hypothetical protein